MKPSFEENKVRRLINTQGKEFVFERMAFNDFKERIPTEFTTHTIKGIYHQESSYVTITEKTGSRSLKKVVPLILTLWETLEADPILLDDEVSFNGIRYRVNGITNVQEGNFAGDISLEVIA